MSANVVITRLETVQPAQLYPMLDEFPSERLRRAREAAGYPSAAAAAKHAGINLTTYQHHENGRRPISASTAQRYAATFKVSAAYLLYGGRQGVPIVGSIMDNGRYLARAGGLRPLPDTEADAMAGVLVHTDTLAPAYRAGDVAFYRQRRRGIEAGAEGRDCIVQTMDGESLLCVPIREPHGTWELRTYDGKRQLSVCLRWAALIRIVDKQGSPL